MRAASTPLCHELRVWSNDAADYGDPYQWCALLTWLTPTEAKVSLVNKPVTREIWMAVIEECQRLQIERLHIVRYRRGQRVQRCIDVTKY